jgi:hypothetical protein
LLTYAQGKKKGDHLFKYISLRQYIVYAFSFLSLLLLYNNCGELKSTSNFSSVEGNSILDPRTEPASDGAYLSVNSAFECLPEDPGLSVKSIRRLSKSELVSSLTAIFGTQVMNASAVKADLSLLRSDPAADLAADIDNSVENLDNLLVVFETITKTALSTNQQFDSLFPSCQATPTSANCLKSINNIVKKIYRRPATKDESTQIQNFISSIGNDREAFRYGLIKALLSPFFHQHMEIDESSLMGNRYRLNPYEIASRISYQLTGGPPDSALMLAADNNQLTTLDQIKTHGLRLVTSTEGKQHLINFFYQWLRRSRDTDPHEFIQQAHGVSSAGISLEMASEFDSFLNYIIHTKKGSFYDLYTDRTVASSSQRVASLMSVSPSTSPVMGPAERSGFLLRPLVTKSNGTISNLVNRGVVLRRHVLCDNLPSPDLGILKDRTESLTLYPHDKYGNRFIINEITKPNVCMGCHSTINPMGFVMENYDSFGGFRTQESIFDSKGQVIATHAIDASIDDLKISSLQSTPANNAVEMVQALGKSSMAMRCMSQQLFRFQQKRLPAQSDGCSMNNVVDNFLNNESVEDSVLKSVVQDSLYYRAIPNKEGI